MRNVVTVLVLAAVVATLSLAIMRWVPERWWLLATVIAGVPIGLVLTKIQRGWWWLP